MSLFKQFPVADFGLKNQILARANDARPVFERNCHQSRHPASSSKTSFLDLCWQESYTKRAGQQTLNPRSIWNFSLFKARLGKFVEFAHFAVKTRGPRSSSKGSCLILIAPINISNGKNAATKAQIQNFAENQHFWQLLSRNVETALMAQHSRKDCGHLRVFLLKHLFCNVFPISEWWGPCKHHT